MCYEFFLSFPLLFLKMEYKNTLFFWVVLPQPVMLSGLAMPTAYSYLQSRPLSVTNESPVNHLFPNFFLMLHVITHA